MGLHVVVPGHLQTITVSIEAVCDDNGYNLDFRWATLGRQVQYQGHEWLVQALIRAPDGRQVQLVRSLPPWHGEGEFL